MHIIIVIKVHTNLTKLEPQKDYLLAGAKEGGKKLDMKGLTYN